MINVWHDPISPRQSRCTPVGAWVYPFPGLPGKANAKRRTKCPNTGIPERLLDLPRLTKHITLTYLHDPPLGHTSSLQLATHPSGIIPGDVKNLGFRPEALENMRGSVSYSHSLPGAGEQHVLDGHGYSGLYSNFSPAVFLRGNRWMNRQER